MNNRKSMREAVKLAFHIQPVNVFPVIFDLPLSPVPMLMVGELGRAAVCGTWRLVGDATELLREASGFSSSSSSSVFDSSGALIVGGSGDFALVTEVTDIDLGFTMGLSALRLSGVGVGVGEGAGDGVAEELLGTGEGVAIVFDEICGTGSSRMFSGVEGRSGVWLSSFGSSSIGVRARKSFCISSGAGDGGGASGSGSFVSSTVFFRIPAFALNLLKALVPLARSFSFSMTTLSSSNLISFFSFVVMNLA